MPDMSADLDSEAESKVSVSVEQEATLLELCPKHAAQAAQTQDNSANLTFHGKEPPKVQNALHSMAQFTPTTAVPTDP